MNVLREKTIQIPLNELRNIEKLFFRQIQMTPEKAIRKYKTLIEETKHEIFESVSAEAIYTSEKISEITEDYIIVGNNCKMNSRMLARSFAKSEEVIVLAVTIKGYDELENSVTDFMKEFMYDGWGTAIAESAYAWLKEMLRSELEKEGLHCTCAWSPGQHNVDIKLQKIVFEIINTEKIGLTLGKTFMMKPKKSISGLIGVGTDKDVEKIRACDLCERRETCPSAYADQNK